MWRKIFNPFLFGMLLLCAAGHAQEEKLIRAQQLLYSNSELALAEIDSVILHPQTKNNFISWTTRAYIYFDLYKRSDRTKLHSAIRDSIISSLVVSQRLNPDSAFTRQNKNLFMNIAAGYYNLAKTLLQDSIDSEGSFIAYNKFKEVYALAEPDVNFKSKDIEYNLAVGSLFLDRFMQNTEDEKAGEVARLALMKVLELQPDNPSALINLGLMHYNQAAHLSQTLPFDAEFDAIEMVQENMVKLAKQAEQFIVKVYNADNNNPKAVQALFYIYRMLLDFEKSDAFRVKCKELGIDVEQETPR